MRPASRFLALALWIALALGAGLARASDNPPADSGDLRTSLFEAESLLAAGDRLQAVALLNSSMPMLEREGTPLTRALAVALLGRAYLQLGQLEAAAPLIQRAVDLSASVPIPGLAPAALNDLGLLHVAAHDDDLAFADYARALSAATAAKMPEMAARIRLNRADLHLRRKEIQPAQDLLETVIENPGVIADRTVKARLVTGAAARLLDSYARSPDPQIAAALKAALADANAGTDLRLQSEIQGELGRFYERVRKGEAGLAFTRKAMFAAQAAHAPELLYRWEWQAGRIRAAQGRPEEALADYQRALASLQPIRHDLLLELRATDRSYRDALSPFFLEYLDLLLRQAAATDDPAAAQSTLRMTREVVEQMKTAQLEDYFRDDCVARFEAGVRDRENLETGTAVIYPILLADRLELLLGIGDQLQRFSVAVPGKTVSSEALRFRKLLVRRDSEQYRPLAQELHGWLIEPLLTTLRQANIETLVIVPDGALLGIPYAALHDGAVFLIERYAIATVPGLHLIEPGPHRALASRALLGGLSESVQGFPALPAVEAELGELGQVYSSQRLANRQFTFPSVRQAVDQNVFEVVHIASHGKFEADARKSFLLTYDGRMDMDGLERIVRSGRLREDPVDLLTLSACETAAGDERAALGLAGMALKAGARSVVATLWFIDDQASSTLVGHFYRELGAGGVSKAKAMQIAQRRMIHESSFQHPGYWAPFLVIGNWR